MSIEKNKSIARQLLESWNGGQQKAREARDAHFAPGFEIHVPGIPGPLNRQGFEQMLHMFSAAFVDDACTVEGQVAEGDMVSSRWTWKCTHTGDFQGIPATGKRIAIAGIHQERFADGKVAERWMVMDQAGMLQQITAESEPARI